MFNKKPKCKHEWKEYGESFVPADQYNNSQTIIYERCGKCGEFKRYYFAGKLRRYKQRKRSKAIY